MRGVFKLSLAAAGILLLATGAAFAQDDASKPSLKITGLYWAAFGQITYDKATYTDVGTGNKLDSAAFSEYVTSYEMRTRFIYGNDELSGKLVLRPRGNQSQNLGQTNSTGLGGGTDKAPQFVGGLPPTSQSIACKSVSANTVTQGSVAAAPGAVTGTAVSTATTTACAGSGTDSPALADVYGEVSWNINKQMNLNFGRFEGNSQFNPLAGTYLLVNPVMDGPEYWMNQTNINGLQFTYNGGPWNAGVALYSQCRPSCAPGTAAGAATEAGQTIVPFFQGKFGDIMVQAQLPQTAGVVYAGVNSGKGIAEVNQSTSGSGYQLGVAWTGMPGMTIALDLQSFTDNKVAALNPLAKDINTSGTVLKFEYMGFQFGYFDKLHDTGGTIKPEETYMKLVYKFKVGPGFIGPEFTTATYKAGGQTQDNTGAGIATADASASLLRLVGGMAF